MPASPRADLHARAALVHAAVTLVALAAAAGLGRLWPLALGGVLSLAEWARRQRAAGSGPSGRGGADAITALRVGLCAAMALLPPARLSPWAAGPVLLAFALDGVDGWWARRTHTVSRFGAAFDQEADALLVAMTSAALVIAGGAPGWVLAAGALRYGYVIVVHGLGLHGEAPRSTLARYVFATVMVALIVALARPGPLTRIAACAATLLLGWSFARSLWWSWRGPSPEDG